MKNTFTQNRFDKPYRILPTFDKKKALQLFDMVGRLSTHEVKQFVQIEQIPLDMVEDDNGNCLIHEVINIDSRQASEHSKLNHIKFLYQYNVNPDKMNKMNQTPLHLACKLQLSLIIEYLLSIGVNSNYKDNNGNTPFHYLLTGDIKLIEKKNEINDFIDNTKEEDDKIKNQLIELKNLIWEFINPPAPIPSGDVSKDNLYNFSLLNPKPIIPAKDENYELPDFMQQGGGINDDIPLFETLKNTIDNILSEDIAIKEKKNELLKVIADLGIMQNTQTRDNTINEKVGSIKLAIKKMISKKMNDLKKLDNFEPNNSKDDYSWSPIEGTTLIKDGKIKAVIKRDMKKQMDTIEKDINDKFVVTQPNNDVFEKIIEEYKEVDLNNFNDIEKINIVNDKVRHDMAVDNASSIIDFKNLRYTGGPRNVAIDYDAFEEEIILNNWSENKKLIYLLCKPLDIDNINNDNVYDLIKKNKLIDMNFDFIPANKYKFKDDFDNELKNDTISYLILAFTAIKNPGEFKNLIENELLANHVFFKKWYDLYFKHDTCPWIFNMWCAVMCKQSSSNLECTIPHRLLMLIAGLSTNPKDKIQGVINAYKPELIKKYPTIHEKIITLLNDNMTSYNTPNNNKDDFFEFIKSYFAQPNTEYKYYKDNMKSNEQPMDMICRLILEKYNKMENKPLVQTVLDMIFFIREFISDNMPNFSMISTSKYMENLEIDERSLKKNLQPSRYSLLNYIQENDTTNNIKQNHLRIAHTLGLFYMGTIETIGKPDYDKKIFPLNYLAEDKMNKIIRLKESLKTSENIESKEIISQLLQAIKVPNDEIDMNSISMYINQLKPEFDKKRNEMLPYIRNIYVYLNNNADTNLDSYIELQKILDIMNEIEDLPNKNLQLSDLTQTETDKLFNFIYDEMAQNNDRLLIDNLLKVDRISKDNDFKRLTQIPGNAADPIQILPTVKAGLELLELKESELEINASIKLIEGMKNEMNTLELSLKEISIDDTKITDQIKDTDRMIGNFETIDLNLSKINEKLAVPQPVGLDPKLVQLITDQQGSITTMLVNTRQSIVELEEMKGQLYETQKIVAHTEIVKNLVDVDTKITAVNTNRSQINLNGIIGIKQEHEEIISTTQKDLLKLESKIISTQQPIRNFNQNDIQKQLQNIAIINTDIGTIRTKFTGLYKELVPVMIEVNKIVANPAPQTQTDL